MMIEFSKIEMLAAVFTALTTVGVPVGGWLLNRLSKARHGELVALIQKIVEPHGHAIQRLTERVAHLELRKKT